MRNRISPRATALGLSMSMSMIAVLPGCTEDDPPQTEEPQPLSNPTDPVVVGDGSESTEAAAIEFSFDPVLIEDGRVFDRIKLIPSFAATATWDPATLDEDDPSTYPPAAYAFRVQIHDLEGQPILESSPHQFYPIISPVEGSDPSELPSPFASATWTYYELTGCEYEIDPDAEGAAEWLAQVEGFVLEIASTDWDEITDLPGPDPDPVPVDPTPAEPIEVGVEDNVAEAGGLVREIPRHDVTWPELIMICWDAWNEVWHWKKIVEKECYKGQPPKFTWSWDCGMALSGFTNKGIQALACSYLIADKLGLVPTSDTVRDLLRTLLISYALSGKPQNVPKLPPPPAIVKPKGP